MKNHFDRLITFRTILIIISFLIVVFVTVSGISCQSPVPAPAPGGPSATPVKHDVTIGNFAFTPATITIPVGTAVVWTNKDSVPHTVTARDNSFDSGNISRDDTFSYTFGQSGTFEYYCRLHPLMTGKIVVE